MGIFLTNIMYKYLIIIFFILFSSCSRKIYLKLHEIESVHVLFKCENERDRYSVYSLREYKLLDNSTIAWGKNNSSIKLALKKFQNRINSLPRQDPKYLEDFLNGSKATRYKPIKVRPLNEFGYVRMKNGETLFYGIDSILIDLTNDIVYYK